MKEDSGVKISILIATCNRSYMLQSCIESLVNQKTTKAYEIIILDQSDQHKRIALFEDKDQIRVVRCNYKNKSKALNNGVGLALANYIAVVDDDCIVNNNWVDSMYKALKENPTGVITGRVIAGAREGEVKQSRLNDNLTKRVIYKKDKITPIFKLSGCNFGFDKMIYKITGPFNEEFGPGSIFKSADDNEWSYRVSHRGLKIIYEPEVIVTHRSWRSSDNDVALMSDYGYAAGAFFKFIFKNSKLDFAYHSIQLWWWLLKTIVFSLNYHEIKCHVIYGFRFIKGFVLYQHQINNVEKIDCVFVLSPGVYIGGAERYIENYATELRKKYKVNVLMAISHNKKFYSECKMKNLPSIYLGDSLRETSLTLHDLLKNKKVRTVISNGYHSSYTIFLTRARNLFINNNCNYIDIKHGWITTNKSERFKTFCDKLSSIIFNSIIIVDPAMKNKLWFTMNKNILFVPTGVLTKNKLTTDRVKSKPLRILLIGRLAKEKRFELVLEALYKIPKDWWSLTIVGDGSEKDLLKQITYKKGLSDRVKFVGYQKNVEQYYRNSDLLIISSINEGCPLVALEAMVHKVLVLSTEVGYMPTLLDKNRGILIGLSVNSEELSKKIKDVINLNNNIINQMLRDGQSYVSEHHNQSKNVKKFYNLIQNKIIHDI